MKTELSPVHTGQIPSTSIRIGNVVIHQSANGLYSLNDLHKASGGAEKDKPNRWSRAKAAKDYIEYLAAKYSIDTKRQKWSLEQNQVLMVVYGGSYPGIYANRKLSLSYALWLSPMLHDMAVEAFDAYLNYISIEAHQALENRCSFLSAELQAIEARRPAHKQALSSILGVSPTDCRHYYEHLESIGEVQSVRIPQPDKIVYRPTPKTKTVTGKAGDTLLFHPSVKSLFPKQTSWMGA